MSEVERISSLLKDIYNGEPWHGSSLKDILKDITSVQAASKPDSELHSIWEIILHMTGWREVAWKRLKGEEVPKVTKEKDWPEVKDTNPESWNKTLEALELSQQQLIQALSEADDEKIKQIAPGSSIPLNILLDGIIQHDLYHSGQIALLKKFHT